MSRTELINFLIRQRNGKRYLEIGVYNEQHNFSHILCDHKVGVDFRPVTTFTGTSDEFFSQNQEDFDLIFIDGIHTEAQALKDIENAYHCLAKDGLIIIHDCMPPDEWHQRGQEAYKEGENWNGTVWKTALRIFNNTTYKCTLLDTDWGCGVIDMSLTQAPLCRHLPEQLDYATHYPLLLQYKKSVADYLRDQVKVFYHLACMGNWEEVFKEQMLQLQQNGFREINITMLGNEENLNRVKLVCGEINVKAYIIFHSPDINYFETPAFLAMEEYARQNDGFILYLHSKGVSNPEDMTKIKWRRLMMRELIEKWESCMLQLPNYDAIGVNWREMPPTSHFSGNFWYASTRYLRKLARFKVYYDNPQYPIWDAIYNKRLGCEFWISSGKQTPKVLSLFCQNIDFCTDSYWLNK